MREEPKIDIRWNNFVWWLPHQDLLQPTGGESAFLGRSGEAEYYAMVKAASVAIGIRSMLMDLGVQEGKIVLKTDASAALGVAQRLGIGKIRHIEVNQLWLQEKVYKGEIIVDKVSTDENLADALTKPLTNEGIMKHVQALGYEMRQDRHRLAHDVTE